MQRDRLQGALLASALAVGLVDSTQAGPLIEYSSAGVDLVYEDDYTPFDASVPGLTWTADANLAASQTFGVVGINPDGSMTWDVAQNWIAAMNAANYGGANDWRLWSALNSDGSGPCGPALNCTDSELGHLSYTEGPDRTSSNISSSTALASVFTNLLDSFYWSGTDSASSAWGFANINGYEDFDDKDFRYYGWAVRLGQVAAAPLPGTAVLMALGLVVLAGWRGVSSRPRGRSARYARYIMTNALLNHPDRVKMNGLVQKDNT